MEKKYDLSGCRLVVVFEDRLIRILKPRALQRFLSADIEVRTNLLVKHIKLDYFAFFKKELQITDESMVIEIWGHAYASYFAKALKNLIKLKLVEDAADFIIEKSDRIDCGEPEVDSNRRFWDVLSTFNGIILSFLPKKIKA